MDDLFDALARTGSVGFTVRVHANAKKSAIVRRMQDGSLKIDIAALPVSGKANLELIRYLSKIFNVQKKSVTIVSGEKGKRKLVRVTRS